MGVLRRVRVLGLSLLLSASGCYAHVALTAPPASAPLPTRVQAYNRLKPVAANMVQVINRNGYVGPATVNFVELADGQEVHYPEDLLPVVAPTSTCALSIKRYLPPAHTASTLYLVGTGLSVVGLGVMAASVAAIPTSYTSNTSDAGFFTLLIAGSALAIAGAVTYLVGAVFGMHASQEAQTAFATYDEGLQAGLRIKPKSQPTMQDASPPPAPAK